MFMFYMFSTFPLLWALALPSLESFSHFLVMGPITVDFHEFEYRLPSGVIKHGYMFDDFCKHKPPFIFGISHCQKYRRVTTARCAFFVLSKLAHQDVSAREICMHLGLSKNRGSVSLVNPNTSGFRSSANFEPTLSQVQPSHLAI